MLENLALAALLKTLNNGLCAAVVIGAVATSDLLATL
jgi:hypothetical protein